MVLIRSSRSKIVNSSSKVGHSTRIPRRVRVTFIRSMGFTLLFPFNTWTTYKKGIDNHNTRPHVSATFSRSGINSARTVSATSIHLSDNDLIAGLPRASSFPNNSSYSTGTDRGTYDVLFQIRYRKQNRESDLASPPAPLTKCSISLP